MGVLKIVRAMTENFLLVAFDVPNGTLFLCQTRKTKIPGVAPSHPRRDVEGIEKGENQRQNEKSGYRIVPQQ